MNKEVKDIVENYVAAHTGEAETLLMELGKIPAPSHMEDKRAGFCRNWLLTQGAHDVTIDDAKNVVCRINCEQAEDIIVFMAHTDIVFPDSDPLPMTLKGRILYAPGIGDDTANLVNLLMAAKYILQNAPHLKMGFLIVANACEEGLGNLKGCKEIVNTYGSKIKAFYSFDGNLPGCTYTAVGSYRYKITVKTAGGHSWTDFGQPNAIQILCRLVERLYALKVPEEPRTTYNVGHIEGGTTVNSIAQEASMLFEFRSVSQNSLIEMNKHLESLISEYSEKYQITKELLGIRPGNGNIDKEALKEFTALSSRMIQEYYDGEIDYSPGSTDSNIPLSMGIPANTIGTVCGGQAHTREEWVDLDTLPVGMKIILSLMLHYTERKSET